MKKTRGWARVKPAGAHLMRLGAWYQVVDQRHPSLIVLDIAGRNVPVFRDPARVVRMVSSWPNPCT